MFNIDSYRMISPSYNESPARAGLTYIAVFSDRCIIACYA